MSLLTSMSSGTTGLSAASSELAVVADNIANANTVGFKAGRAAFEDALVQTVVGGLGGIGLGARLQAVQRILNQGALTTTGVGTDLALQGKGFFMVEGTSPDGRTSNYLTRAGQFTVNENGYLTTLEGLRVQGFPASALGAFSPAAGNLLVGTASSQPNATTDIEIRANLQGDTPLAPAWDPADPANTSNFATSATIYDSLGKSYQAQLYFRRTGAGAWDWYAMTDGAGVTGGTAGVPSLIGNGTVTFDTSGRLQAMTQATNFLPAGAVQPQPLTFNFGDPIATGGTGLSGITGFAAPSASTFVGQNGWASGLLTSIQIDRTGVVVGVFTNGQTRPLGQIAIATVAAPDRLERTGGNLFAETQASGQPVLGAAGTGGRAYIASGALEQSNVDIAEQFVRMIASQRAFEANSKSITTADQLLSELIAMKR